MYIKNLYVEVDFLNFVNQLFDGLTREGSTAKQSFEEDNSDGPNIYLNKG